MCIRFRALIGARALDAVLRTKYLVMKSEIGRFLLAVNISANFSRSAEEFLVRIDVRGRPVAPSSSFGFEHPRVRL